MTLDPQRRRALLEAKLPALVGTVDADANGADQPPAVFGAFGPGAAMVRGTTAWVLAEDDPSRALGRGMAWARQAGAAELSLLAERDAGLLARRASYFRHPPRVWEIDGTHLVRAQAEPRPIAAELDARIAALAGLIAAGGAEPVVEHGVLTGEVAGLEVCRAVIDPYLEVVRLEVGVGAHDREAFQLLHGDVPPVAALEAVVASVAPHRQLGAPPHPLNRLAAERLLRHRLRGEPALVGVRALVPVEPPVPRRNVKEAAPCVAEARDASGRRVVVVCSVGIDLDLVPFAADARDARGGGRLVLAVPERDVHPVTTTLAEWLQEPADIVGVPGPR